jgi:hypothetical protein
MSTNADKNARDEAIARYYARDQEGLPPLPPSRDDLYVAHRHWLMERWPQKYGHPPRYSQAEKYQAYLDERNPPPPPGPPEGQLLLPLLGD